MKNIVLLVTWSLYSRAVLSNTLFRSLKYVLCCFDCVRLLSMKEKLIIIHKSYVALYPYAALHYWTNWQTKFLYAAFQILYATLLYNYKLKYCFAFSLLIWYTHFICRLANFICCFAYWILYAVCKFYMLPCLPTRHIGPMDTEMGGVIQIQAVLSLLHHPFSIYQML